MKHLLKQSPQRYGLSSDYEKFRRLVGEREGRLGSTIRMAKSVLGDSGLALDVGTGNGFLSRLILEELGGVYIVGVDINLMCCKMAKNSVSSLNFDVILADAQHLPFRKDVFDLIVAAELIEHLPQPIMFLRDAHTSLRRDGAFVASTPNIIGARSVFFDFLTFTLHNISRMLKKQQKLRRDHINLLTYEMMSKILGGSGFDIKHVEPQGSGLVAILEESLGISIGKYPIFPEKIITLLNNLDRHLCRKILPIRFATGWVLMARKSDESSPDK